MLLLLINDKGKHKHGEAFCIINSFTPHFSPLLNLGATSFFEDAKATTQIA
jgi:hypothetical protein